MLQKTETKTHCFHCQDIVPTSRQDQFCCDGCKTVFQCLNAGGLENFYEILDSENRKLPSARENAKSKKEYEYLEDQDFQKDFGSGENKQEFWFYVNGIECLACTWLFNHLKILFPKLQTNQFLPDRNILKLKVEELKTLKDIVYFISTFGYKLVPLKDLNEANEKLKDEKKRQIKRIGIVGAIWMNLMIYSISVYAGAEGLYEKAFSHIQALIYFPVLTYGAWPFLQNLGKQLKYKHISIDLPLSISILFGSALSYYHYFIGSTEYYFDSLTTFIFLILSVRYFLKFIFQNEIQSNALEGVYGSQQVKLDTSEGIKYKYINQIKTDDVILIETNEIVPLDGTHLLSNRLFNESLISGESDPINKGKSSQIHAGSINLSEPTKIKVNSRSDKNIFQEYLEAIRFDVSTLDRYSTMGQKYTILLMAVIIILACYFYLTQDFANANLKTLSLLIVCCPCALGIGIPLASLLKMKSLAKEGILIKNSLVLERFDKVDSIIFDKTGTLTSGQYKIKSYHGQNRYLPILNSMEKNSLHPIGKFLYQTFKENGEAKLDVLKEIPGQGPQAILKGREYRFKQIDTHCLALLEDEKPVLSFYLEELVTKENIDCLQQLSLKYDLSILTGDTKHKANQLIQNLGLENYSIRTYSEKKPKEKESIIQKLPTALYVGDGLNDILALKKAFVSISTNANQMTDDAADIVLLNGHPNKINIIEKEIKHLHNLLNHNILISIIYNLIAISLIFKNQVSPLIAAILMPISSIIIVLHIYLRMHFHRKTKESK